MARTKKNAALVPETPEAQSPTSEPESPATPLDPTGATDPAKELELVPARERLLPYKAKVCVALAVVHKAVKPGTADMLKPVGTLKEGAVVTVINRLEGYVQLANGLWIDEAFLAG